jgi:hypothetical protein
VPRRPTRGHFFVVRRDYLARNTARTMSSRCDDLCGEEHFFQMTAVTQGKSESNKDPKLQPACGRWQRLPYLYVLYTYPCPHGHLRSPAQPCTTKPNDEDRWGIPRAALPGAGGSDPTRKQRLGHDAADADDNGGVSFPASSFSFASFSSSSSCCPSIDRTVHRAS